MYEIVLPKKNSVTSNKNNSESIKKICNVYNYLSMYLAAY